MVSPLCYLDNNATTRVDPRVFEQMTPFFCEQFGNPSSSHHFGSSVGARIEHAREQVASEIGARPDDMIFTSGGTEADNLALMGTVNAAAGRRRVVTCATEHPAVLDCARRLEQSGTPVTIVPADVHGHPDMSALADALDDDTLLVSIMLANNETGVVTPVREIVDLAHSSGVLVHTDAVNALGKLDIDVGAIGVDLLSVSAHKAYGPKGIGALWVRPGTPLSPLIVGGSQERRRRGGTSHAPGIIGFGAACAILGEAGSSERERIRRLRDRIEQGIRAIDDDIVFVAEGAARLGNTTCVCVPNASAEAILMVLSAANICASSGAACSSGSIEPSHVLTAMQLPAELASGQLRFSLGRFNNDEDIERLLDVLPSAIQKATGL